MTRFATSMQPPGASWGLDGKTLASASDDGTVRLWSSAGKTLEVLRGHARAVRSVSFDVTGERPPKAPSSS